MKACVRLEMSGIDMGCQKQESRFDQCLFVKANSFTDRFGLDLLITKRVCHYIHIYKDSMFADDCHMYQRKPEKYKSSKWCVENL